jgi:predicted DNA-binding ribbon-helix-helix protein
MNSQATLPKVSRKESAASTIRLHDSEWAYLRELAEREQVSVNRAIRLVLADAQQRQSLLVGDS